MIGVVLSKMICMNEYEKVVSKERTVPEVSTRAFRAAHRIVPMVTPATHAAEQHYCAYCSHKQNNSDGNTDDRTYTE